MESGGANAALLGSPELRAQLREAGSEFYMGNSKLLEMFALVEGEDFAGAGEMGFQAVERFKQGGDAYKEAVGLVDADVASAISEADADEAIQLAGVQGNAERVKEIVGFAEAGDAHKLVEFCGNQNWELADKTGEFAEMVSGAVSTADVENKAIHFLRDWNNSMSFGILISALFSAGKTEK